VPHRVIVALDSLEGGLHAASRITDELCDHVAGFKVGLPLVLRYGVAVATRLRSICSNRLWIADFKLADIGEIMKSVVEPVAGSIDAVIAHSFVGVKGALGDLKAFLDSIDKKLILVATMSHPGAEEVYDHVLDLVDGVIEQVRPWGLVAPATRPAIVARLRRRHPWATILAPGVGVQGARPGTALCHGADYEIAGRMVTLSHSPLEALKRIGLEQEEALRRCRERREA